MQVVTRRSLTNMEQYLLARALHQYTKFCKDQPLTEALIGRGSGGYYDHMVRAGLMVQHALAGYIDTREELRQRPKRYQEAKGMPTYWYRLTDLGASLLQQWIDAGFNWQDVESNNPLHELFLPIPEEWRGVRWEVICSDGNDGIGWGDSYRYYLVRPDGKIILCDQYFTKQYEEIEDYNDDDIRAIREGFRGGKRNLHTARIVPW